MNAEQKRAWFCVVITSICIVGYLVLLPFFGLWVSSTIFALFGLNGFAGNIGKGEKTDERDKSIARRATREGFTASYMTFILWCMGTWVFIRYWRGEESVSIDILPLITMFGFIVCYLVRCIVILVLYNRHVEAGDA